MTTLYTARAVSVGGRAGHVETDDKRISADLGTPGGDSKPGVTNPEQLFACGYAACFGSAVDAVAKKQNVAAKEVQIHSEVNLNKDDNGFSLSVTLNVGLPGVDDAQARKIVEAAHQMCPYSKAIRGNVEVTLKVNNQPLKQAA